jgi:hypothetical protein
MREEFETKREIADRQILAEKEDSVELEERPSGGQ